MEGRQASPAGWPLAAQAAMVIAIGAAAGLAANSVGSRRIPWRVDAASLVESRARRFGVATIGMAEAVADWRAGRSLWLDVRAPADYARGHIPWAISAPAADLAGRGPAAVPSAEAGRPLIVYCRGPTCDDGLHAAAQLKAMGFRDVRLFPDGLEGWRAGGMDLERAEGADASRTP